VSRIRTKGLVAEVWFRCAMKTSSSTAHYSLCVCVFVV